MQNFLDINFDTTNMTLEELQENRKKIRELLSNIEHQILLRKMANRKHSSGQTSSTE